MMRTTCHTLSFSNILPRRTSELLFRLREKKPRVHAITNSAAQVFTANLLLAVGALPSLTFTSEEISSFSERASALLVNLGTLDSERRSALPIAIRTIQKAGRPWILDPVFVDASPTRLHLARNLLAEKPDALRCNSAEFMALTNESCASRSDIIAFSKTHSVIVACTGPIDIVSDGTRCIEIANGHPFMSQTTAMGCAGTALIAAFLSLTDDRLEAVAAALLVLGIAGELAGETARGPGSFPIHFLDRLYHLDTDTISERANIS